MPDSSGSRSSPRGRLPSCGRARRSRLAYVPAPLLPGGQARLLQREALWKRKQKKRRISPAERTRIASKLAPTSIFDCFWRMRIRSNYGTIDPYLVEHISEADHAIYNSSLCTTTRASVALLELFIMRKIGKPAFALIATAFNGCDDGAGNPEEGWRSPPAH